MVFYQRNRMLLRWVEVFCKMLIQEGLICLMRSSLGTICAPLANGAA